MISVKSFLDQVRRRRRYRRVFSGEDGEWVLADMLYHFGATRPTTVHAEGGGDPILSAFNDGRASVPLTLYRLVKGPLPDHIGAIAETEHHAQPSPTMETDDGY